MQLKIQTNLKLILFPSCLAEAYWNGFSANLLAFTKGNNGDSNIDPVYNHSHPWNIVDISLDIQIHHYEVLAIARTSGSDN
jgi:hypothetical protein